MSAAEKSAAELAAETWHDDHTDELDHDHSSCWCCCITCEHANPHFGAAQAVMLAAGDFMVAMGDPLTCDGGDPDRSARHDHRVLLQLSEHGQVQEPPADAVDSPLPRTEPPPAVARLSATFAAAAEELPATYTRIQLTAHGQSVGSIEVISQCDGQHLIVGRQEWLRPADLASTDVPGHFAAVSDRLMDEAVALAERLGASLSSWAMGSSAVAERLSARGFVPTGAMWYRAAASPDEVAPPTVDQAHATPRQPDGGVDRG